MLPGNLHPSAPGFTIMAQHIANALVSQGIITSDLVRSGEVEEAERLLDLSFTESGIINQGTFNAKIGKHGTVNNYYDAERNTYYGCTKAKASDYYYATYDDDSELANAFNGNLTWEVLVRLEAEADADGNINRTCILGNEENGGWAFYNSDLASTFTFAHKSGVKSSVKSINGDSILVSGKFYHLVVTMDRLSHVMRYFINGKLVCTGTRAGTDMMLPQCGSVKGRKGMWICLGGDAKAGSCTSGAENSSACSFVFARIYNGALSKDAAIGLYNDDVKRFTEPLASHGTELLMDMRFTPDGAVNYAPSYPNKPIEMMGEVPINYNADINQYEAQFNGTKSQFFKYNVGNDPLLMNTLSEAYSVEVFCRNNTTTSTINMRPLGFLNGYGFGLQINTNGNVGYCTATQGYKSDGTFTKTLWTYTEGGTLSTDYTHYVIVFDRNGKVSQLYIDGELARTRSLTTKECPLYEWTPTTWLAIGGDAKGTYDATTSVGTFPFKGDIALARIYGRALEKSEIQSLQGILTTQERSYTLGYNGYAAVCLPYIWQVPEGCTAYIVVEIDSPDALILPIAQAGECVPYGTPVLLKGTARETVTLTALNMTEVEERYLSSIPQTNLLVGVFPGKTLAANEGSVTLPAFSCYLPSDERRTYYKLEEIDATGISDFTGDISPRKVESMFDLSGRRVAKPQRGIFIKGNRKVLVR